MDKDLTQSDGAEPLIIAYFDGVYRGAKTREQQIVDWLRSIGEDSMEIRYANMFADKIEKSEHRSQELKKRH